MKITTFNPQIITKNAEPFVSLFQELGFEVRHNPEGIGDLNVEGIRMKDANGFYLDISQPDMDLPQDVMAIRMNVDDFDEALEFLKAKGFRNVKATDETLDTATNKSAMIVSPSGFAFDLCQHLK